MTDPATLLSQAKCYLCLGISLEEALELALLAQIASGGTSVTPKMYVASLTQSGASAPVPTVEVNTLGATPVWARTFVGTYTLTLANAFTSNKTIVTTGSVSGTSFGEIDAENTSTSVITVTTQDVDMSGPVSQLADGLLSKTAFIVSVYP